MNRRQRHLFTTSLQSSFARGDRVGGREERLGIGVGKKGGGKGEKNFPKPLLNLHILFKGRLYSYKIHSYLKGKT